MKTLMLTDVDNGQVLDQITLSDDGAVTYKNGIGQDLIDALVRGMGITPAEAFDMRTNWSNGYVQAKLA